VLQGSPIGRAGDDRPTITVELRQKGRPIDITRLVG
jgi:murein hydrolase activator